MFSGADGRRAISALNCDPPKPIPHAIGSEEIDRDDGVVDALLNKVPVAIRAFQHVKGLHSAHRGECCEHDQHGNRRVAPAQDVPEQKRGAGSGDHA